MKVLPFKIPSLQNESIKVEREVLEKFYPHFHTHEELQFIWIIEGEGTAFIGDKILSFQNGDLFLISSNLPHVFKSDITNKKVESLSIYFSQHIFTANAALYEFESIIQFLQSFNQGLWFVGAQNNLLKELMLTIERSNGLARILGLMELIHLISISKNHTLIASAKYSSPKSSDGEKISNVIEFLYEHYADNVSLAKVADIANLSPQAFCRYFKRHTKKSMVQYLNQIRIGKVCGWLQEKKFTVTESCYQAGFNNISNFNRQFKAITGYTPSSYMTKQKNK